MEAIVLKYVQLVCLTILMSNDGNCAQLMSQTEETNNFKASACTAECLKIKSNYNLTSCYQECLNQMEMLNDVDYAYNEATNSSFRLYCRDAKRLVILFENDEKSVDGHVADEKFIYVLVVQETTMPFVDRFIYISDEPLIELRDLKPSESYNISASIVSSNYTVEFLNTQIFTTLKSGYVPENVTEIWVAETIPIEGDNENVTAVIGWDPARDQTCLYKIILHGHSSENGDMMIKRRKSPNLYYQEYNNLKYNSHISVAVRGINTENPRIESGIVWKNFEIPSCMEVHANKSVCGPTPIKNMTAEFTYLHDDRFDVNVTWSTKVYQPEYFTLELKPGKSSNGNGTGKIHHYKIEKNQTSFFIPSVLIDASDCFVYLVAHKNGKIEEGYLYKQLSHLKNDEQKKSDSKSYNVVPIVIFIVILLLLGLCIWKSSFDIVITDKYIDNMDLDLIKTITNRSMLEAIADLTRDELMEVERENIQVMETLGEGNFGLVKIAIIIKNNEKNYVAVKMLKNTANIDDIKQFHQEISVMKSIGRHPNIVSIIGHCTSNIEELMLLTEFCDAGNLLELLRSEFAKQINFYDKKISLNPKKFIPDKHNFDSDEKELSYKNFGCSSRLFVVNQMYDDLNNNSNNESEMHQPTTLKAIEMTATNALYLQLSDNDPKPVIVEIHKPETHKDFLSSSDLISFAKQVCDGMEFLARKKVVHRDLAARNVLVCSDKTVKIADFGLSRDIYQDNIYRKVSNGKLPIKWLAIESMTHQEYTSQSDVWSFGILLYEIVTLGATPYPSIQAEQLLKILQTGYRMEKPKHCHQEFYDVMMSCWHASPSDRPAFDELSSMLNHFLKVENSWDERFIDLPKLFDKCSSEMNYMKPIA